MTKKVYNAPEIEITEFEVEDIITLSVNDAGSGEKLNFDEWTE